MNTLANTHVLPDSRLQNRDMATVMGDWMLMDGQVVRIEISPIYCANCGIHYGWIPRDNTSFACWLCAKCFEKWGEIAGTYAQPDDEFRQSVAAEMQDRFGKHLSDIEIAVLAEDGKLGKALELLEKESPYPIPGGNR